MWHRLVQIISLTAVTSGVCLTGSAARAGIDAAAICKDKKLTVAGRHTQALSRAFGRNFRASNSARLAVDISKADSRLTRDFAAAERASSCLTTGDADTIGAKDEALVADVLARRPTKFVFTTTAAAGTCGRINDDSAGTGTDLVPYGSAAAALDCGNCGEGNETLFDLLHPQDLELTHQQCCRSPWARCDLASRRRHPGRVRG